MGDQKVVRKLHLVFGATAEKIKKQLRRQGFSDPSADYWQQDADAITRLSVRGLITQASASSARKRLLCRIRDCVAREGARDGADVT